MDQHTNPRWRMGERKLGNLNHLENQEYTPSLRKHGTKSFHIDINGDRESHGS